jgi:hypothetical protein
MHETQVQQATQPQLVIGLGSGRCGTHSLAHLLNQQSAAKVYHERVDHQICWHGSEQAVHAFLDEAIAQTEFQLIGDVAFYYLPYVEAILARQPGVKFICLQRACTETVVSYLQKTSGRNHWMAHDGKNWQLSVWDDCYPKYAVPDKESALTLYWYEYYFTATRLQALYPQQFRIFPMTALNSKAGQRTILAFLGIPEAHMRFAVGIRVDRSHAKQWPNLRTALLSRLHALSRLIKAPITVLTC